MIKKCCSIRLLASYLLILVFFLSLRLLVLPPGVDYLQQPELENLKSNDEKVQVDYEDEVDDSDYGGDSDDDYDEDDDNDDGYPELENGLKIDPSRLLKIQPSENGEEEEEEFELVTPAPNPDLKESKYAKLTNVLLNKMEKLGTTEDDFKAVTDDDLEKVGLKPTNILLLAYARSGSSFAGDLLSASQHAAYYFEPLVSLRPGGISIERAVEQNWTNIALVREMINGIFDCDWTLLKTMNSFEKSRSMRKNSLKCKRSNPKVVKTIRLHKTGMEPWIYNTGNRIKVVHLVRDPRGMIKSITNNKMWGAGLKNATYQCQRIGLDLKLEQSLGSRYIRVRYEDLVDNPEGELRRLYGHLGMQYTEQINDVVLAHTKAGNNTRSGYFNTFRNENFRHDSWKQKLGLKMIRMIERACRPVMRQLNYPVYQGTGNIQEDDQDNDDRDEV